MVRQEDHLAYHGFLIDNSESPMVFGHPRRASRFRTFFLLLSIPSFFAPSPPRFNVFTYHGNVIRFSACFEAIPRMGYWFIGSLQAISQFPGDMQELNEY